MAVESSWQMNSTGGCVNGLRVDALAIFSAHVRVSSGTTTTGEQPFELGAWNQQPRADPDGWQLARPSGLIRGSATDAEDSSSLFDTDGCTSGCRNERLVRSHTRQDRLVAP
jgi:hypothetical protein